MKKLMTLMLALSFLTATVAVSFAQDTKTEKTTKKGKKGKKKSDTTEKKGGSLLRARPAGFCLESRAAHFRLRGFPVPSPPAYPRMAG